VYGLPGNPNLENGSQAQIEDLLLFYAEIVVNSIMVNIIMVQAAIVKY